MFAFVEMLVFVIMTLSGFFYIWKRVRWIGPSRTAPNGSCNDFEMLPDNLREHPVAAAVDALTPAR